MSTRELVGFAAFAVVIFILWIVDRIALNFFRRHKLAPWPGFILVYGFPFFGMAAVGIILQMGAGRIAALMGLLLLPVYIALLSANADGKM